MPAFSFSALSTSYNQYTPAQVSWFPSWLIRRGRSQIVSSRISAWVFYGAAIISGITLHLMLAGSYVLETPRHTGAFLGFASSSIDPPHRQPSAHLQPGAYVRPGLGQLVSPEEPRDLDDLRAMISQTKGYFTRDYSLWLGWNNVRFSIFGFLIIG